MGFHFAGSYIAAEVCICALSVVMQIIILNMYHAQGNRPVPVCLLVITQRHKGTKIGAADQKDLSDQDPAPNNTQNDNGLQHHKVLSTHRENRERRVDVLDDKTLEMVKEEWQLIARVCDIACFVVFIMIHVLLIISVIFLLLKWDNQKLFCWRDKHH